MKKIFVYALVLCVLFAFCACNSSTPEPPLAPEVSPEVVVDEHAGLETVTFENLEGTFVAFAHIIQPHAFTQEENSFSGNIIFTHGTEAVPVSLIIPEIPEEEDTMLTIGDQSLALSLASPYGIDVIDLNIDDADYELAVYDAGMSADYSIHLYAFKNGEILSLGHVDADKDAEIKDIGPCFGVALCDMHGTIVDPWYCVRLGEPGTVLQYKKIAGEEALDVVLDPDISGKTYTVKNSFPCFFKPLTEEPENYWDENVYFNEEYYLNTQEDDVFKILKGFRFEDTLDYIAYYVEYNGTTGLLFPLLGD